MQRLKTIGCLLWEIHTTTKETCMFPKHAPATPPVNDIHESAKAHGGQFHAFANDIHSHPEGLTIARGIRFLK